MTSTLVSRNIYVGNRRTSLRLEPEMWLALREVAEIEKCKTGDLFMLIYTKKDTGSSLTAAVRVFLMLYYRAASTPEGHKRAGHGIRINNILSANNMNQGDNFKAQRLEA